MVFYHRTNLCANDVEANIMAHSFRITGLVAATNRIRADLRAGILPSDVERFGNQVTHLITQVEQLCGEHGRAPRQLPLPSYQAYQFLKSLDLNRLPMRQSDHAPAVQPIRIKNLLRICAWVQNGFVRLAEKPTDDAQVATVLQQVQTQTTNVEAIIRDSGSEPATLPLITQRAFAWLKFLSAPDNFALHCRALQVAKSITQELDRASQSSGRPLSTWFEFYNIPTVYRARYAAGQIRITASEGLIGAPEPILRAVVQAATTPQHQRTELLRTFAASEDCIEILASLESFTVALETNPRGVYHDLDQVFARVNVTYFNGRVAKPRLAWNKTPTYRKLGHYQPATNTIMLSLTLDSATVPSWAIDLVMYHEMLHQVMGARVINGQRYSHTPAFRAAEKRFHEYAQAKQVLDNLIQHPALGPAIQ